MTTAKFFDANPTILAEPIPFGIRGHRFSTGGTPEGGINPDGPGYWQEEFKSVRVMPGAVLDKVAGSIGYQDGEVTSVNQAEAIPIIRKVIDPEDRARFEALLSDSDRAVDIKTLWEVAMHLVEALSGRPTGASGD